VSSPSDVPDVPFDVLLTVAYDGERFSGFAPQPSQRTVFGELLTAVRVLDDQVETLRYASRTDAGVHARGQLVAISPRTIIPPRGWVLGLDAHLPNDVAVRRAREVPKGFEPRASRLGKRYRYRIMRDAVRNPLLDRHAWRLGGAIDVERGRAEAALLLGTHDFKAFRSSADARTSTIRTIRRADVVESTLDDARMLDVIVEGDAFLHNMVRIVVGTIVDVAMGRLEPGAVVRAVASGRRDDLGVTAPAHGLTLDEVFVAPTDEWGAAWP
jgi:tRNA pseudouridine38-40 synthase